MVCKIKKQFFCILLCIILTSACLETNIFANESEVVSTIDSKVQIYAPSAVLMEASTGQIIYEKDALEPRSPASITKIMTLLLTFEAIEQGKLSLSQELVTSEYAASMGGSQVFLEEGEKQTVDTLIKCVAVASGNDAAVVLAEAIGGTESGFVELMNEKANRLGLLQTHFEDCCGLCDLDSHVTCAMDVAVMSRELINKYPQIYDYTRIWMEDITHVTQKGVKNFTLSSTNKLLKQYEYTTGLKTGSTSKALFCLSATARKDNLDLIAVVMASPSGKTRVSDAKVLLSYGFGVSQLYRDDSKYKEKMQIVGGTSDKVAVGFTQEFSYLDTKGNDLSKIKKRIKLNEKCLAPVKKGEQAGVAQYYLQGKKIGERKIFYLETVLEAKYKDYVKKVAKRYLL